jgi:hypothetical protein
LKMAYRPVWVGNRRLSVFVAAPVNDAQAVRLREHSHNLTEGLLEKSKLAQHAYEESHRVVWDEAKIL